MLDQVTDVVLHPVVGIKKCLDMLPGALNRVRMSASTYINEKSCDSQFGVCSRAFLCPCMPTSSK
jgi:hypothetical protein